MGHEDGLRAEIGTAVVRFIADVVLHNVTVGQRLGLGPSDLQFLTLLGNHGPLTPGRLAALTGLSTGTVTGVIDRLEKGGYVRRDRDGADRRKVLVSTVPESLARLAEFYTEHGEHMSAVLATRDADQLRAILDFMTDMNASPGRPHEDPRPSCRLGPACPGHGRHRVRPPSRSRPGDSAGGGGGGQ